MAKYIELNHIDPQPHRLKQAVDCLRDGGVIAYPTDSVYAFGCDLTNPKAIAKLCQLKGVKADKKLFSFIFSNIKQVSEYSKQIDNNVFKAMKKALPGPYTFILNANNKIPKILQAKKKTLGARIPNQPIATRLVEELGSPIITTSIKSEDITEHMMDPWAINERFENQIDLVIDGGPKILSGGYEPSTVVDCTDGYFSVIREGLGDSSIFE